MTIAFNALNDIQLGYAAVFVCIGFGLFCLKVIHKKQAGPGYWSLGFLLNAAGFLLWSGIVSLRPVFYYLAGEIFHVAGFFSLVYGAIRFSQIRIRRRWLILYLGIWLVLWTVSILNIQSHAVPAGILLKLLRSLVFYTGGWLLLASPRSPSAVGKNIAGGSLILWASFVVLSAFISMNRNLFFGFLVGFQVLAAFGMVALLIDRLRSETEKAEYQVRQLEGILPICSYCKNIRDEKNQWRRLEEYIEDRSKAEFSHGICPECFAKHRPDR